MRYQRKVVLTIAEAEALPGLLGRIVPAMLKAHGRYAAVVDGRRVLFVRKGSA
jgi:hypothetical protein